MRGLCKILFTTYAVLISYFFVTLPAAYYLAFFAGSNEERDHGMGIVGLWWGMMFGQIVLNIIFNLFLYFKINWEQTLEESKRR